MYSENLSKKDFDLLLTDIDKYIDQINELYKKYKYWNIDYINEYKKIHGFSIDEVILIHINKKLKID